MAKQTAISARIDNVLLWNIGQEVMRGETNRNQILNTGAQMYLDLAERRRLYMAHDSQYARKKIVEGFLQRWWPEAAKW